MVAPRRAVRHLFSKRFSLSTEIVVRIEILSAGGEDPGGINSFIKVNGIEHSRNERGFNFVVLSCKSSEVISTDSFDVWSGISTVNRMITYINWIKNGSVVLISIKDEASFKMTKIAEQGIHSLGATTRLTLLQNKLVDLRYRASFALVARKGGRKPSWFMERAADRRRGPSRIKVYISLGFC